MQRLAFAVLLFGLVVSTRPVYAQDTEPPQEEIVLAQIDTVFEEGEKEILGSSYPYQIVNAIITKGSEKGKTIRIVHGDVITLRNDQKVKPGETVVIARTMIDGQPSYAIVDKYRIKALIFISFLFLILVLALSRLKGLGSIVGLIVSLAVIVGFIVPQIVGGQNPLVISIIGSLIIMCTTMYLAHGFSKQTTVALISTFITLTITAFLSAVFVYISQLTGLGNEEAYSLQLGPVALNYKGLLLGGIIIGSLGVLDDITTGQTAAVVELSRVNKSLGFHELVTSGLNIGKEHISSLVNTLVLAYAGVSLPIFIFFAINPTKQPLWFILNSEFVAEEIVRTLTGSIGLVLAVPITTLLASWAVTTYHLQKR